MPSAGAATRRSASTRRHVAARCDELWAAERAFARLRADAAASDAVAATVAAHNVDWLRVDCDWLEAADENVAREAALLARVDGVGAGRRRAARRPAARAAAGLRRRRSTRRSSRR